MKRSCGSAEQPAHWLLDDSVPVATTNHISDLLMQSIDFHGWYTSARYAMVSKTWKQAVDKWRRQLKQLSHINCSAVNDAVLNVVAKSCPGLHTLDLGICQVIKEGGITECRSVRVTAAALEAVAKGCPRLQHLNLAAGFQMVTAKNMDEKVLPFLKYCPSTQPLAWPWPARHGPGQKNRLVSAQIQS